MARLSALTFLSMSSPDGATSSFATPHFGRNESDRYGRCRLGRFTFAITACSIANRWS